MNDQSFPDVRWGSDSSYLRKPAGAFAATRFGSWLIRVATPLDRKILIRSSGRRTLLGPIGAPVVLLTTTGRKSGLPRTTPLLYVREDDRIFVVGSNFGQQHHPAWTANLLAQPHATVTMGGVAIPVLATPLSGAEQRRIYEKFKDTVQSYEAYENRTSRDIRVFALTRR